MPRGSLDSGLLKEILDLIHKSGPFDVYDSNWVTDELKKAGYWQGKKADTPERTINSYFTQNPLIFSNAGRNKYRLNASYIILEQSLEPIDDKPADLPSKVETKIIRTLRDTEIVRSLKSLHDNKCQICSTTLAIGKKNYSEGHHILPLGENGPDIASNILILCPNHHVLCDYRAIRLELNLLRADSRHTIDPVFIDWHNAHLQEIS